MPPADPAASLAAFDLYLKARDIGFVDLTLV